MSGMTTASSALDSFQTSLQTSANNLANANTTGFQLFSASPVLEALPLALPPLQQQHLVVSLAEAATHEERQLHALIRNRQQQLDAHTRCGGRGCHHTVRRARGRSRVLTRRARDSRCVPQPALGGARVDRRCCCAAARGCQGFTDAVARAS